MESLQLSYNAVAPLFVLMLIGYFLKKIKLTDKRGFDTMNKMVFKVFLPVLLFYNLYKTDLGSIFDGKLVLFTIIAILINFALGYAVAMCTAKENAKRGVILQGTFRSNFALLGLPFVGYLYGSGAGGVASLMVSVVVPIFNILAIFALTWFGNGEGRPSTMHMVKEIFKNPLIIACLFGVGFLLLDLRLPSLLESSVKDVAAVATPLALIALGAEFEYQSIRKCIKEITVTVSAKLIWIPLLALSAAACLGIRGEALVCVLITFGAPVAVSSFTMAQQTGGDEQLAAHLVVISSALCLITLFGWTFLLSFLGLL